MAHDLPQFDLNRILSRYGDGLLILKVFEDYTISLKVYFISVSSHFLNLGVAESEQVTEVRSKGLDGRESEELKKSFFKGSRENAIAG